VRVSTGLSRCWKTRRSLQGVISVQCRTRVVRQIFTPNHNASQLLVLWLSVGCSFYGVAKKNQFILSDRNLRADALKHLTLIAFPLDWNSTFLHGLTHLQRSQRGSELPASPFSDEFSRIARCRSHFPFTLVTPSQSSMISIPTMKDLRISAPTKNTAMLLSILKLPSTVNIRLTTGLDEFENYFYSMFEIFKSLSAMLTPTPEPSQSPSSDSTTPPPSTHIKSYQIVRRESEDGPCDFRVQAFRDILT